MKKFVHRRNTSEEGKPTDEIDASKRSIFFNKQIGEENEFEKESVKEKTTEPNKDEINQKDFRVKTEEVKISPIQTKENSNESQKESNEITQVAENLSYVKNNLDEEKQTKQSLAREISQKSAQVERAKANLRDKQIELEKIITKKEKGTLYDDKFSIMGKYTSQMAHDIRNPLTFIKLQVDLMKLKYSNQQDDLMLKSFSGIEKAVEQITSQINDVMNFLRDTPIELKKCNVHEMLKSCLDVSTIPEGVNIELSEKEKFVECDQEKTKSVFANLIKNALQAVEQEGDIIIGINENEGKVIITIQDSGKGIPEESMEKIFEPLFTTKREGTGLGLSNCKEILEKENGSISVKNNPTTFTIELPSFSDSQ